MAKKKVSAKENEEKSIHQEVMKKLVASKGFSMRGFCDTIKKSNVGFVQTLKRGSMDIRTLIICAGALDMDPRALFWELLTDEEKARANSYASTTKSDVESDVVSEAELKNYLRANAFAIRKLLKDLE